MTSCENTLVSWENKLLARFLFFKFKNNISRSYAELLIRAIPRKWWNTFLATASRSGIHSKPARGDRFPYMTLIAFANANSAGDCERRRGNPMQLLQGFEKDLCHRALTCVAIARTHARTLRMTASQLTSRRRAMRVTRYARDLRPECGMAPDRTLAIDRVASHPRQTGLINPRQQPSLALLTSSSERTKAPGQQNARVSSTHPLVVYLRVKFCWLHSP